tara:strand:- start:1596 stop:1832 length:237 start_codon:yes stop_codon:yes gene_type:complete
MENRYFIISASDSNLTEIISVSVGSLDTQRYSINKSQIVIKLHKGDTENYPFLSQYYDNTHSEILQLLNSTEWIQPIT